MPNRRKDAKPVEMLPGLMRRTLASGKAMMICEFTLNNGVQIPLHNHPHEQVGYVVSGKIRLTVGSDTMELGPGDTYLAPAQTPHSALALEPTVLVDTFSPPREEYR